MFQTSTRCDVQCQLLGSAVHCMYLSGAGGLSSFPGTQSSDIDSGYSSPELEGVRGAAER